MQDHVVYFLGAGFSAPLGIPVVRDFWWRAVDAYYARKEGHTEFQAVRDSVQALGMVASYYKANLFDIEEVLSLLEMEDLLAGDNRLARYQTFISDVIRHYTPELKLDWSIFRDHRLFGVHPTWTLYGDFFLGLLHAAVGWEQRKGALF